MSLIQEALKRQQEEAGKSKPAEAASSSSPATPPPIGTKPIAVSAPQIPSAPLLHEPVPAPTAPPAPPPPLPPPAAPALGLKKNVAPPAPAPAAADTADTNQPIALAKSSDDGKKKKIIIIAAAAVLLIAVLGGGAAFLFLGGGKAVEVAVIKPQAAPTVEAPAPTTPVPEAVPAQQAPQPAADPNPATPAVAATTAPEATTPPPAVKEVVLWPPITISGIVGKGAKGSVIINGEILSVGEETQEVLVKEIKSNGAVLLYKGETKFVKVGSASE